MSGNGIVSIVIPSRNEKYLKRTIEDLLVKAKGNVQIIAVLDGYWPPVDEIVSDPRVSYIHFEKSKGMRNAINAGAAVLASGEYLMKIDAHCMVAEGYDLALKADCQDNWVVVPRRKRLDPDKWALTETQKPDVDYMYLSNDLHGVIWPKTDGPEIDDLMSFQGSCWFMKKAYFDYLELMDEKNYGTFPQEAQEIGLKAWLSGGRVVVNKKTWYAHWHKPKDVGRGYSLDGAEVVKGEAYTRRWLTEKVWHKQIYPLSWLIEKFSPVPTWPEEYVK